MSVSKIISQIPEEEKSPTVLILVEIIRSQAEENQQLKDEIARLKGINKKPKISPSKLEDKDRKKNHKDNQETKRAGFEKRKKIRELSIHDKKVIAPDNLPKGSTFYINVDDTGARHKGKNGYCTHIGNEMFAYFESTESKSRVNFLTVLRGSWKDYVINPDALCYILDQKFPKNQFAKLSESMNMVFQTQTEWEAFPTKNKKNSSMLNLTGYLKTRPILKY